MTDITEGLDLLGDWLDAKGYTEEAGLCTRAMDEINRLRDKNIEYEQAMMALQLLQRAEADVKLRAENARLQKENWEYVARGYALINMLPDETMAGEIQDARRVFGGIVEALRAENARLQEALKNARADALKEGAEIAFAYNGMPRSEIAQAFARAAVGENDE